MNDFIKAVLLGKKEKRPKHTAVFFYKWLAKLQQYCLKLANSKHWAIALQILKKKKLRKQYYLSPPDACFFP